MKTKATIEPSSDTPCAACPWRAINHGKRHPEGWYTKRGRRDLWNGLRTGEALGMTCHPTDGAVQPVADYVETRECAGAILLLAREWISLNETLAAGGSVRDYQRGRRYPFTKAGAAAFLSRLMFQGDGLHGRTIKNHEGIEHGL